MIAFNTLYTYHRISKKIQFQENVKIDACILLILDQKIKNIRFKNDLKFYFTSLFSYVK